MVAVAHFGTGPVSVSWTAMPCAAAAVNSPSSWSHTPAGYAAGSVASKRGRVFDFGAGA